MAKLKYDYSEVPKLAKKGLTKTEISKKLGIPYKSLKSHCRYHHIKTVIKSKEKYEYRIIIALAKKGLTKTEITNKTGISFRSLKDYCEKYNT